jgi:N-carbamoylputrescine amidase
LEPEHFRAASRPVTVAAIQFSCDWNIDSNIAKAERAVRAAAASGAQIILLPELFETP